MTADCYSPCAKVNPDASRSADPPGESDTSSAFWRGFSYPCRSVGIAEKRPSTTHAALPGCTPASSTAVPGHTWSTQQPALRIGHSTAVVRRPWLARPSRGLTSSERAERLCRILAHGARPPRGQWERFGKERLVPLPVFFLEIPAHALGVHPHPHTTAHPPPTQTTIDDGVNPQNGTL